MSKIKSISRWIKGFIPILEWLPKYNPREDLIKDIIGGLTVGIMHIPQGMAYASLANLQPVNGLYTSFFAPLIYMFFGTSRHVSLGVFAVVSLMSGSCNVRVTEELLRLNKNGSLYESMDVDLVSLRVSTSLTLFSGLVGIIIALIRLDFAVSCLSDHVIKGFTTGAAVHVFVAQLNKIMGVKLPRKSGIGKLFGMIYELGKLAIEGMVNYYTLGISLITIVLLFCAKEYLNPLVKKKIKQIPIPYDLIVMVIGVILSALFKFQSRFDIKVIGHIPRGMPIPALPDVMLFPYMIYDAVTICLVALVVTVSMGKLFAKKHGYRMDDRQEFYALGLCGVLGSFFPIWPPSTALARTLVYEAAGTKTQLASIFSCALLLSMMLFLGTFLQALPVCLLSCIIIVALKGMFLQLAEIPKIWRVSFLDALTFVVTTVVTIGFDVVEGLLAGVIFSFGVALYRAQKFEVTAEEKEYFGDCEPKLIIKVDGALFYMNVDKIKKVIEEKIQEVPLFRTKPKDPNPENEIIPLLDDKLVTVDMSSVQFIDFTGVTALLELISEQKKLNIRIVFKNFTKSVQAVIEEHPSHKTITSFAHVHLPNATESSKRFISE